MISNYIITWKHHPKDKCVTAELVDDRNYIQAASVFADDTESVKREINQIIDYARWRGFHISNPGVVDEINEIIRFTSR